MKRKPPVSEQHKHCATERKLVRKSLREKGPSSVVELEKQYEELCRLREQVQVEESRQRLLLRYLDDVGR
jgi:hypothetical protein